jgi:hypothetical protein
MSNVLKNFGVVKQLSDAQNPKDEEEAEMMLEM